MVVNIDENKLEQILEEIEKHNKKQDIIIEELMKRMTQMETDIDNIHIIIQKCKKWLGYLAIFVVGGMLQNPENLEHALNILNIINR